MHVDRWATIYDSSYQSVADQIESFITFDNVIGYAEHQCVEAHTELLSNVKFTAEDVLFAYEAQTGGQSGHAFAISTCSLQTDFSNSFTYRCGLDQWYDQDGSDWFSVGTANFIHLNNNPRDTTVNSVIRFQTYYDNDDASCVEDVTIICWQDDNGPVQCSAEQQAIANEIHNLGADQTLTLQSYISDMHYDQSDCPAGGWRTISPLGHSDINYCDLGCPGGHQLQGGTLSCEPICSQGYDYQPDGSCLLQVACTHGNPASSDTCAAYQQQIGENLEIGQLSGWSAVQPALGLLNAHVDMAACSAQSYRGVSAGSHSVNYCLDVCPSGEELSATGMCDPEEVGDGDCPPGEALGQDGSCYADSDGDGTPDDIAAPPAALGWQYAGIPTSPINKTGCDEAGAPATWCWTYEWDGLEDPLPVEVFQDASVDSVTAPDTTGPYNPGCERGCDAYLTAPDGYTVSAVQEALAYAGQSPQGFHRHDYEAAGVPVPQMAWVEVNGSWSTDPVEIENDMRQDCVDQLPGEPAGLDNYTGNTGFGTTHENTRAFWDFSVTEETDIPFPETWHPNTLEAGQGGQIVHYDEDAKTLTVWCKREHIFHDGYAVWNDGSNDRDYSGADAYLTGAASVTRKVQTQCPTQSHCDQYAYGLEVDPGQAAGGGDGDGNGGSCTPYAGDTDPSTGQIDPSTVVTCEGTGDIWGDAPTSCIPHDDEGVALYSSGASDLPICDQVIDAVQGDDVGEEACTVMQDDGSGNMVETVLPPEECYGEEVEFVEGIEDLYDDLEEQIADLFGIDDLPGFSSECPTFQFDAGTFLDLGVQEIQVDCSSLDIVSSVLLLFSSWASLRMALT